MIKQDIHIPRKTTLIVEGHCKTDGRLVRVGKKSEVICWYSGVPDDGDRVVVIPEDLTIIGDAYVEGKLCARRVLTMRKGYETILEMPEVECEEI